MSAKKIVSLLPAATEIVCALGLEEQLVGRSHECKSPEFVKNLPVCSVSHIDAGASSEEIDRQVRAMLDRAASVYEIDKEQIRKLQPDVILTQDQCDVCAVSFNDVERSLRDVTGKETQIVSLHASTLGDVSKCIMQVAAALQVGARAEVLLEELQERIEIIRHKLKFVEERPSVACIEWISPLMTAGNWCPEMIEIAGGKPVLATAGKPSAYIDAEALSAANPDVIIVAACGFPVERTLQEISALLELPQWSELNAVKNNRIYIADGDKYFNKPGPGLVDTIEMLAEMIHPKQFIFGFEGRGWLNFAH